MPVSSKAKKSGWPHGLAEEGPAGEVKTSWQPEAFTWYGDEVRRIGNREEAFIYINKREFRVSQAAAKAAAMRPRDRVQIGFNATFLALRQDEKGIPSRPDAGKATTAIYLSATALIRKLEGEGWPMPVRLPCVWDEESGMLVARKPSQGASS